MFNKIHHRTIFVKEMGGNFFLQKPFQSIPDSSQVGKVVAMVGMAVGVVIGVGISRALQVRTPAVVWKK